MEKPKMLRERAEEWVDGRESEQPGCFNQSYGRGALEDNYMAGFLEGAHLAWGARMPHFTHEGPGRGVIRYDTFNDWLATLTEKEK